MANNSQNVVILAIGARGDVQPYIALAQGFVNAGLNVRMATHGEFESLARRSGVEDFYLLEGNPRKVLETTEEGQAFLESGSNPLLIGRRFVAAVGPLIKKLLNDSWQACQGADKIIFSPFAFFGHDIAEKLAVPAVGAFYVPMTRTHEFPSILSPVNLHLGKSYNRLTHLIAEQTFWLAFRKAINTWRAETLGLQPAKKGIFNRLYESSVLYGFSPSVVPRPSDWPEHHRITGYWFLEDAGEWDPPSDLVDFIASGPPPVYIGFGSMVTQSPGELVNLILDALKLSGQRGVLQSGWGKLKKSDLPEEVYPLEDIPHNWLFPKMAGLVHHGGAGTTGTGIRAGIPSVTVPFFGDQPFWGQRLHDLGIGPKPIPKNRLATENLAAAIQSLVERKEYQTRAAWLRTQLKHEHGVMQAVDFVTKIAG